MACKIKFAGLFFDLFPGFSPNHAENSLE